MGGESSQNTGLFGALRLKDLPIIQINPYGVFFDFAQTVNDYSGYALMILLPLGIINVTLLLPSLTRKIHRLVDYSHSFINTSPISQ
jgi:hypothetical protein